MNVLSQVFFTPNIQYTISFDLANDSGVTPPTTQDQFLVLFNGQKLLNLVNVGASGPTHYSFLVNASVPGVFPPIHIYESTISFVNRQDPSFWELTHVQSV